MLSYMYISACLLLEIITVELLTEHLILQSANAFDWSTNVKFTQLVKVFNKMQVRRLVSVLSHCRRKDIRANQLMGIDPLLLTQNIWNWFLLHKILALHFCFDSHFCE